MADLANLRTASLYINNQLLSRGLLRDGEVLDFSDPSRYDGGTGAAMGRIMGIVNDLILRRDRDAEHRESLSTTLRSLRADNLRQTTDLTRLAEKQAETERKLNISEAAEASARAQLKSAEAAVRGLKDEMARMKTLVAQTRAACATEVRRRDRNIDGLKKQLGEATRARGSVRNPAITVISVTGEIGLERGSSGRAADTSDSQYDLRSETNEFLTELAKGLSEENEALSALLRRMREELRAMSGWEREAVEGDEHAVDVTTNVDELEADLNAVLDHMRTILTNPSFVPLEEVVTREEEITRLREGWVKMESRWKEAVQLIDEWRRRMATSGMPVDDKEMDLSLRLSPMRVRDAKEPARVVSLGLACVKEEEEEEEEEEDLEAEVEMEEDYAGAEQPLPAEEHYLADDSVDLVSGPPADNVPASDAESSVFDDPADMEGTDDEEPNVEILQQSAATSQPLQLSVDSSPLPEPPQLSPLKVSSSAGNRRGANEFANPRHKARGYTTTVEEETCELVEETHTQERLVTKRRTQSRPTRTAPSHSKRQKVEPEPEVVNSSVSSLDSILLDSPSRRRRAQLRTRAATKPRPSTTSTRTSEVRASEVRSREATPRQAREAREAKAAAPPDDRKTAPSPVPVERAPTREAPTPVQLSPKRTISRVPLARPNDPAPQQSPLTMAAIAAKLAASEREADAARVRAKLKAARTARRKTELAAPMPEAAAPEAPEEQEKERDVDPVKRDQARRPDGGEQAGVAEDDVPVKRKRDKRASKVASRRRSTLSPWELESLISGNVAAAQAD